MMKKARALRLDCPRFSPGAVTCSCDQVLIWVSIPSNNMGNIIPIL